MKKKEEKELTPEEKEKLWRKHLQHVRKTVKDGDETVVVVVEKLDLSTLYKPTEVSDTQGAAKVHFKSYAKGEITSDELAYRLTKLNMNPAYAQNKVWLKKIISQFFYGKDFVKLIRWINEAK